MRPITIENTVHPEIYYTLQGVSYTRIKDVTITKQSILFNMAVFIAEGHEPERLYIEINDPTCIRLLPTLLKGEISCFDALKKLEKYFLKKYDLVPSYGDEMERILMLQSSLMGSQSDPFVHLCAAFPRTLADSENMVYITPVKAVNDEIIQAVKQFIFDHSTLQTTALSFIRDNYSLFANKIDTALPERLAHQVKSWK